MKKAPFALSLIAAGLLAAGSAAANEYGAWRSVASDDDTVSIADSFNKSKEYSTESTMTDDDVIRDSYNRSKQSSVRTSDDDVTRDSFNRSKRSSWESTSSDDDSLSIADSFNRDFRSDDDTTVTKSQDNDYTHTEDNDQDNDVTLDFQLAMPELSSDKDLDQHAGHQSDTSAYGEAYGHSVGVQGGTNMISAGNEKTYNAGPVFSPVNVNSVPVNTVHVSGNSYAPIDQSSTTAGGDIFYAPKTVVENNLVDNNTGNLFGTQDILFNIGNKPC